MNAFPLSWPAGWPRAPQRKAADFGRRDHSTTWRSKKRLEVADGVNRVLTELDRLSVDRQDVIISTNVRTRLDGLPRSGEAEPKDPGAAVYWQDSKGHNRVMAIDRYQRVADNLAAIAATLEALRAIERHGGGQILERAFTGFEALPNPEAKRTWQEVLGVDIANPTIESVRDKYIRLRSQHHPDKGGDPVVFDQVEKAYAEARQELGP